MKISAKRMADLLMVNKEIQEYDPYGFEVDKENLLEICARHNLKKGDTLRLVGMISLRTIIKEINCDQIVFHDIDGLLDKYSFIVFLRGDKIQKLFNPGDKFEEWQTVKWKEQTKKTSRPACKDILRDLQKIQNILLEDADDPISRSHHHGVIQILKALDFTLSTRLCYSIPYNYEKREALFNEMLVALKKATEYTNSYDLCVNCNAVCGCAEKCEDWLEVQKDIEFINEAIEKAEAGK